jgi:CheY-like chemotaxis protein
MGGAYSSLGAREQIRGIAAQGDSAVRAPKAQLNVWPYGEDAGPEETNAGEAYDSFGPISDIRKALSRPAQSPVLQAPHDSTRILVAEPDAFHRRVLRVLLSCPHISLIEVEDGKAAVDLLALRGFDLLLLDLDSQQMTAAETIRWIRRSLTPWADMAIIGVVGDDHRPGVGKLMSMGMTDWVGKPFVRQELVDKLIAFAPGLTAAGL